MKWFWSVGLGKPPALCAGGSSVHLMGNFLRGSSRFARSELVFSQIMTTRLASLHGEEISRHLSNSIPHQRLVPVRLSARAARLSGESRAAEEMIARFTRWQGKAPQSIAADASYGNGELLQFLMDRQITPYMPTRDAVARTRSPLFGPERFAYQPESNSYLCPAGQQLNYGGRNDRNRSFAYIGTRPKWGPCSLKSQCTRGALRCLAIHMNEAARQRARDLWNTPGYENSQRQRKKVEALFAELKSRVGLHRLRLRRLKFVQESSSWRPPPRTSNGWPDS